MRSSSQINIFSLSASTLIALVLVLGIGSNYFYGITRLGMVDDLILGFAYIASAIALLIKPASVLRYRFIVLAFAVFFFVGIAFLFNNPTSYLYETYKLTIFLSFIPLLSVLSSNIVARLDHKLVTFGAVLFGVNLIIIGLQYAVTPSVVVYLGLPASQITESQTAGRWVGLFAGVNNFGDAAVLMLLANEALQPRNYKVARYIFGVSVLLSTSKHAILIMLVVLFYLHVMKKGLGLKTIKTLIGVLMVATIGIFLNIDTLTSKTAQYTYLVQNVTDVTNRDADKVEFRALHIASGVSILLDNPLGVGLGVWGDASSKFRVGKSDIPKLEMSDSWMIHILVEQGVYSLFYFFLFMSGFCYAKRLGNSAAFISLAIFFFLSSLVTMGLSSGSWPILFAYLYARFATHPISVLSDRR